MPAVTAPAHQKGDFFVDFEELEAIASGTPAIVSVRPPFTDYLKYQDCI